MTQKTLNKQLANEIREALEMAEEGGRDIERARVIAIIRRSRNRIADAAGGKDIKKVLDRISAGINAGR